MCCRSTRPWVALATHSRRSAPPAVQPAWTDRRSSFGAGPVLVDAEAVEQRVVAAPAAPHADATGRGARARRARAGAPCGRRCRSALIILPPRADQDALLGLGLHPGAGAHDDARPRARRRPPRRRPRRRAAPPGRCGAGSARGRARPACTCCGRSERSSGSKRNGPSGTSPRRCSTSGSTPVPVRAQTGKTSSPASRSAAACRASDGARAVEPVDLVDGDHDRAAARSASSAGDEAVARADALLAVEHHQRHVGLRELALDPALHPRRSARRAGAARPAGRRARAACRRASRRRGSRGASSAACRRRSRPSADDRVDERRLADVRPAGERDEARARGAHHEQELRLEGEHLAVVGLVIHARRGAARRGRRPRAGPRCARGRSRCRRAPRGPAGSPSLVDREATARRSARPCRGARR